MATSAIGVAVALLLGGCADQADPIRLWVSDERGNAVVVVDPEQWTVEQRIPVGKRPRGIQASPDGRRVFVALSGSAIGGPNVDETKLPPPDRAADGIAVLDAASGRVERIIKAGNDPETFAVSSDGATLYVSNEDSGALSVIDVSSGGIRSAIKVGDEPEGIAVTADGKLVFVACEASDAVHVVSPSTGRTVAVVPLAGRPRTILMSRDGRHAYVAVELAGEIATIDVATLKVVGTIPLGREGFKPRPMGMAERPNGNLLVSTGRAGGVLEVDPIGKRVVRGIEAVGQRPWGIVLSAGNDRLYTANGPSGDISEIGMEGLSVLRRLSVGTSPWGVTMTGSGE